MDWFEPRNFKEWLARAFGLRPILLALLIAGVFVSELRFDWIERSLGAYLVKTNSERPESGAIWNVSHRKTIAQKTLEQIITDRMTTRREARDAATLVEIAKSLSSEKEGVMMSPDHFKSLYLGRPPAVAQEILSPFELVRFFSDGYWDRTYFEKNNTGLIIYFLDGQNRVLNQLKVSSDLLYQISKHEFARNGTLEDLANFENRIYRADKFFKALDALPEEVRRGVIARPEVLLKIPGRIIRVGISDETLFGFIELGFEFEAVEQKKIFFIQGHEWAVWQLRSGLESQAPPLNRISDNQAKRVP